MGNVLANIKGSADVSGKSITQSIMEKSIIAKVQDGVASIFQLDFANQGRLNGNNNNNNNTLHRFTPSFTTCQIIPSVLQSSQSPSWFHSAPKQSLAAFPD